MKIVYPYRRDRKEDTSHTNINNSILSFILKFHVVLAF